MIIRSMIEHCIVVDVTGSRKIIFIPRIQLSISSSHSLQIVHILFPVKNAFVITIDNAQGQTHGRIYSPYSDFTTSSYIWYFPHPFHLRTSLSQWHRQCTENYSFF
jgi:hypothetical protein